MSSIGSQSNLMARKMKRIPTAIIIRYCRLQLAKPVYCQNWIRLLIIFSIDFYLSNNEKWSTFKD